MQTKEQKKVWSTLNHDRIREQRRLWRLKNLDKLKILKSEEYKKHGKERYRKKRQSFLEDPNKHKEYLAKCREYYKLNRDHIRNLEDSKRSANPERALKWRLKSREVNRIGNLISSIKKNCKANNIEFNLTKEWLKIRFDAGICELSGIRFDMHVRRSANSPSVDRIDPKGPYTQENCRVILWSLNRAFSNYGQKYFFDLFEVILRKVRPSIFFNHEVDVGDATS